MRPARAVWRLFGATQPPARRDSMMLEASKNLTAKILSKEREQYSQTLAFAFVLRKYPQVAVATHAIAREMIASTAHELDAFMSEHGVFAPAVDTCLANCIAALP